MFVLASARHHSVPSRSLRSLWGLLFFVGPYQVRFIDGGCSGSAIGSRKIRSMHEGENRSGTNRLQVVLGCGERKSLPIDHVGERKKVGIKMGATSHRLRWLNGKADWEEVAKEDKFE